MRPLAATPFTNVRLVTMSCSSLIFDCRLAGRASSLPRIREQAPNGALVEGAWIPVRIGDGDRGRAVEIGFAQPEILQSRRRAERRGEVEERATRRLTKGRGYGRQQLRYCDRVEADRMRKENGVRLGMRRAEAAAERMAKLVMQGHRRAAERGAA